MGGALSPGDERIKVFDEYLLEEREALQLPCGKDHLADPCGAALAISGGGIRSASFALGVIQTLLNEKPVDARGDERCFDRFDYLSTVSGGGYIGGAVSWIKFHFRNEGGQRDGWRNYLGDRDLGTRSAEFRADKVRAPAGSDFTWLDFFRQHGYYLLPSSMSTPSLVGVALRGMLITLSVYTAILALMLWALQVGGVIVPQGAQVDWAHHPQRLESWMLFLGLVVNGAFLLFGIASWLGSIPTRAVVWLGALPPIGMVVGGLQVLRLDQGWPPDSDGLYWRWPLGAGLLLAACACLVLLWWARRDLEQTRGGSQVVHKWQYRVRILYQQALGPLLTGLTLLLAVWSVPHAYGFIVEKLGGALSAGLSSSVLGVVGAIYQFLIGRDKKVTSSTFSTLRILITAALLVYGILLVAYWIVVVGTPVTFSPGGVTIPLVALIGCTGLLAGFFVNANYIGIGRMYRDRLMELFMPDREAIVLNQWKRAGAADQFDLTRLVDEQGAPQRPLHLVNCNVVMVGARQDRFRGRGGDSFVLSARFSGSSATGWMPTGQLGDGHFTLATAVACSGAAASPHTGVAGRGITRNPLVSLLLSLTNVRLGYWIRNPRVSDQPRTWHKWLPPNLLAPGIRQGLFGSGTTENAFFIELTDGGHFDNTGLYELVRRRVKVIVLAQGSCDLNFAKEDLANAIERVRVDFGVHIRFTNATYPLGDIDAELGKPVKRGWAVGTIRYPGSEEPGILLYLQASPIAGMNADTQSYWRRNVDFPNQTTADQFFDEEQLEAYRELGMAIAQHAVETLKSDRDVQNLPVQALRGAFGWNEASRAQ